MSLIIKIRLSNKPTNIIEINLNNNNNNNLTWIEFKELISSSLNISSLLDLYLVLLDSEQRVISPIINDMNRFWKIYNTKYNENNNSIFEVNIRQPIRSISSSDGTPSLLQSSSSSSSLLSSSLTSPLPPPPPPPSLSSSPSLSNTSNINSSLETQLTIFECCKNGNLAYLKELIKQGSHVNTRDSNSFSPLHYAVSFGHLDIVKYLLSEKAFKNNKNSNGKTPFLCAVENGHLDVAKLLVEEKVFTFAVDNDGNSALHLAAKKGYSEILNWLIENSIVDISIRNNQGKVYQDLLTPQFQNHQQKITLQNSNTNISSKINSSLSVEVKNSSLDCIPCRINGFENSLDISTIVSNIKWEDLCYLVLTTFNIIQPIENIQENELIKLSLLVDHIILVEEDGDEGSGIINDMRKFIKVYTKIYKKNTGMQFLFYLKESELKNLSERKNEDNSLINQKNNQSTNLPDSVNSYFDLELELDKNLENIQNSSSSTSSSSSSKNTKSISPTTITTANISLPSSSSVSTTTPISTLSPNNNNNNNLEAELRNVCMIGNYQRAYELISLNVNVNTRDQYFKTPLHYAAEIGHVELCKLLITHKSFKNSKDITGKTPILCAVIKGHLNVIQYLIQEEVFTFVVDEDGNSLLHLAAINNHPNIIDWLLKHCDIDTELININGLKYNQLYSNILIEQKKQSNDNSEFDNNNNSNNIKNNENSQSSSPQSSLTTTPVTLLSKTLTQNINLNQSGDNKKSKHIVATQATEALINACYNSDFAVATRLVPLSDVNHKHESSLTPLHFASHLGNVSFSEILLEAGANPNVQDRKGLTPLHYSCQNRNLELIELLFEYDAKFLPDNRGLTPLHLASISGDEEIVKILLNHGGDINEIDHNGNSSFYYIVEGKNIKLATWILENYHPDIYIINIDGVAPLDIARNYGYVEFCSLAISSHQKYTNHIKTLANTNKLFHLLDLLDWNSIDDIISQPLYVDSIYNNDDHNNNNNNNGLSFLHICAKEGNLTYLDIFINIGANVNIRDNNNLMTPLMYACKFNHLNIVTNLLLNECDINLQDKNGWTAFFYAISSNSLSIAKILYGLVIDTQHVDNDGNTILHIACKYHSIDCLKWLTLNVGLNLYDSPLNKLNKTALMIANKYNYQDIIILSQEQLELRKIENTSLFINALNNNNLDEALLIAKSSAGINPNVIDDNSQQVVFHIACELGNIEIVKVLLELGASINLEGLDGRNSFHCACNKGQLEIIRWLKKIGSSIHQRSKTGLTPLHYACLSGNIAVVRWLIDRGVDPSTSSSIDLSTTLHYACSSGNKELVNWLHTEYQLDFNIKNSLGLRPIDFASREGEVELVLWISRKMILNENELMELKLQATNIRKNKLLYKYEIELKEGAINGDLNKIKNALEFGIDINVTDKMGMTALHHASFENKIEIVKFLLKNNANINIETLNGITPLHLSAIKGHTNIFEYLIKNDANIKQLDKDGNDILIYASSSQTPDLAKLIINKYSFFNECRKNRLGFSSIVMAAKVGNIDLVIWFTQNSFIKRQKIRFFEALNAGAIEVIEEYINSGIDLNIFDDNGDSPLHIICKLGLYNLVQKFIQYGGADENVINSTFHTPLHYASEKGHTEIVKYLCDLRVNINAIDNIGMTPLLYACKESHIITVAYLIGQGANIMISNIENSNALHLACYGGDYSLVQWLCEGFNIPEDQTNIFFKTPRDIAFDMGYSTIVTFLEGRKKLRLQEEQRIQREIQEAEIIRKKKETELEIEKIKERSRQQELEKQEFERLQEEEKIQIRTKELLKLAAIQQLFELSRNGNVNDLIELLNFDIDINSFNINDNNNTALHYACQNNHYEIIEILIHAGANVNILNIYNETPLHLYLKNNCNNLKTFWLLYNHGAKLDIVSTLTNNNNDNKLTPLHYICKLGNYQLWSEIFNNNNIMIKSLLLEDLLRYCIKNNQINIIQYILKNNIDKIDIDGIDENSKTALHISCEMGYFDIVDLLISFGSSINNTDIDGKTPLMYAIISSSYEIVSLLLNNNASIFDVDNDGNTPLHYACRCNDIKIGTLLISSGADIYITNILSESPYQIACVFNKLLANIIKKEIEKTSEVLDICSNGDYEWLNVLKNKNYDLSCKDKNRVCGLHLAAKFNHLDICKILLQLGDIHIDIDDRYGKTPIMYACCNGNFDIVEFLYNNGADLNRLSVDFRSCLHYSIISNNINLINWLIEHNLDCNHVADDYSTPLHDAAKYNNIESAKFLIHKGALINSLTTTGLTPFDIACLNNNFETAQVILQNGINCNIDTYDENGMTSFLQACNDNRFEMVQWLYSNGSNFGARIGSTNLGDTALHITSKKGYIDIVKWLVLKGLNVYSLNQQNLTPIDVAYENNFNELAIWMKEQSKNITSRLNSLNYEFEISLEKNNNINLIKFLYDEIMTLYLHNIRIAEFECNLLFGATSLNQIDDIDVLLKNGASINVRSLSTGMTPLHYACQRGHLSVVHHLLTRGSDIHLVDYEDRSALDISEIYNHKEISIFLTSLNVKNSKSSSSISLIPSLKNNIENFSLQNINEIKQEELNNQNYNTTNTNNTNNNINQHEYELHNTCLTGNYEQFQSLIERKLVNINYSNINTINLSFQRTLLHSCLLGASILNEKILDYLLSNGADPNILDSNGMSSLHLACQLKLDLNIIIKLIKYKGDLTLVNNFGNTSLHIICKNNMIELMEEILNLPRSVLKNLNLNVINKEGKSLLHYSIEATSLPMTSLLLHQGVRVNHGDEYEITPLHLSILLNLYDIMQILLQKGADPNKQDLYGRTPISISILQLKDLNFCRLLHQFGGKLDMELENNETYLHVTCRNGNVELAKWLVRNGLNPSIENKNGKTPVELAHNCGKEDLLEWLLAWIVATKVGRPVEEILAEANGLSPLDKVELLKNQPQSSLIEKKIEIQNDDNDKYNDKYKDKEEGKRNKKEIQDKYEQKQDNFEIDLSNMHGIPHSVNSSSISESSSSSSSSSITNQPPPFTSSSSRTNRYIALL